MKLKKLAEAIIELSEIAPKVRKIKYHLQSQAKPQTTKCSPEYCKELVTDIESIESVISKFEEA
jgi:hypothetical protein